MDKITKPGPIQMDAETTSKMNTLLQQVMVTPEGATAIFTNFYCSDQEHVDMIKSDPKDIFIRLCEQKCDDVGMEVIRRRMDQCQINLLQNQENHWHIVLSPRNIEMVLDEDLEKICGGEVMAAYLACLGLFTIASGPYAATAVTVAFAMWGTVAVIASAAALVGTAVGAGIAVGGLALAGKI